MSSTSLTESKKLSKTCNKRAKNASEELQKYIEKFTNAEQTKLNRGAQTPTLRCYGSSYVALLSTKPKAFSSPKHRHEKGAESPDTPGEMVDSLIGWVNDTYLKDLRRDIVPYGQRRNSDVVDLSHTKGILFSRFYSSSRPFVVYSIHIKLLNGLIPAFLLIGWHVPIYFLV